MGMLMRWQGSKHFRILCGGVLLIVCAVIGAIYLRGTAAAVSPVQRRDLLQTVVTTGRVTSLARVEVSSQLLGSVAAVRVEAGDRVRGGDVLVQLKDDEARAGLNQAMALERELEERLKQIKTVDGPVSQHKVAEAEAVAAQARSNFARVQKLFDAGIASRAELDDAVKVRDVTAGATGREVLLRSNSAPRGSDIKLAEARLNQARAAVAAAREKLARTVITAPGAGTVIMRKVEAGDVVQPGVPVLVLSRSGRTQVTAQIDEKNLGLLTVGQKAVASADAYPDKSFPALLATVVPAVDAQRGTVEVRCDVADPPPYLVPDMTVSLEIEVARHSKVLTVASEAVRDAATLPWLLVVRNGRAERQSVELGIRGSGATEVRRGLAEGELVLSGTSKIKAGSRVRPLTPAGEQDRAH